MKPEDTGCRFTNWVIEARHLTNQIYLNGSGVALGDVDGDGRRDGVAVIAEGLVLGIDPDDLKDLEEVERDAHGNVRIAEVNIGEILKAQVQARLKKFNIKTTIVAKNIGYELRCADPIPFDMEYTRDLGYCATKYLLTGGNAAMVSLQGGHFVPVTFKEMLDPKTGKAKIRLVDIRSTRYAIARRYMIRLRRDDFQDPHELAKFAATANIFTRPANPRTQGYVTGRFG